MKKIIWVLSSSVAAAILVLAGYAALTFVVVKTLKLMGVL